jgi:predicted SnoaL-like aldol condensation-catalyzing enzyme
MTNQSTSTVQPGTDDRRTDGSADSGVVHRRSNGPRRTLVGILAVIGVLALMSVLRAVLYPSHDDGHRGEVATVAHEYVAAVNAHDWTHLETLLAPDFTFHNSDNGFVQDRRGFLAWTRILGDTFPEFTIAVDEIRTDGDVATIRFHVTGAGDASNDRCERGEVASIRVVDHRIVEIWSNYDEFGLHC